MRTLIFAASMLAVLVGAARAADRPRQTQPKQHWYIVPLERIIGAKPACRYMQCWKTGARYR